MTDRSRVLTVVLDRDIREDDLEPLITAIRMLKGVLTVSANVTKPQDYMAIQIAKREIETRLWAALEERP